MRAIGPSKNVKLRGRGLTERILGSMGSDDTEKAMASARDEAKDHLLDHSTLRVDARTFETITDWMDSDPTPAEIEGMKRILQVKSPWAGD